QRAAAAAHAAILEFARTGARPVRSDRERARGITAHPVPLAAQQLSNRTYTHWVWFGRVIQLSTPHDRKSVPRRALPWPACGGGRHRRDGQRADARARGRQGLRVA